MNKSEQFQIPIEIFYLYYYIHRNQKQMKCVSILPIVIFVSAVRTELSYFHKNHVTNSNRDVPLISTYMVSQNFVFFSVNSSSYNFKYSYRDPLSSTVLQFLDYNVSFSSPTQFRTVNSNSPNKSTNSFLGFVSNSLKLYSNNFRSTLTLFGTLSLNQTIVDCIFGQNTTEVFLLLKNRTSAYFQLFYLINSNVRNKTITPVLQNAAFHQMSIQQGKLFIMFQTGLLITHATSNLSFIQFKNFNNFSTSRVSYSSSGNYLVTCVNKSCTIYNFINGTYSQVDRFDSVNLIVDIQLQIPFVIVSSAFMLQQYDMNQRTIVHSLSTNGLNFTGYRTFSFQKKYTVFYVPYPGLYYANYFYQFNNMISCASVCTQCMPSYTLDSLSKKCIKNASWPLNFPPLANISNSSNNSSTNQTNSTTNNTNNSNNSNNTNNTSNINNTNNSNNSDNSNDSNNTNNGTYNMTNNTTTNEISFRQEISKLQKTILSIFGSTLTLSSMKFNPKFLVSLSFFIDDLYYYQFHRNQYTKSARFFMDRVDIIYYFKENPQYLQIIQFVQQKIFAPKQNQIYSKFLSTHNNNPQDSIFKIFLPTEIIIFIFLKIIYFILFLLNFKMSILKVFKSKLKKRTGLLCFISTFFQANFVQFTFYFTIQVLIIGQLSFTNYLNMLGCITMFFFVVIYLTIFYMITLKRHKPKNVEYLIIRSKTQTQGFISQNLCIFLRLFCRTFCHGIFIQNYKWQILSLIFIDFIFTTFTIRLRKGFSNRFIFGCYLCYNIAFLLLDVLFYIDYEFKNLIAFQTYDLIVFITICFLIIISVLITLTLLIWGIMSSIRELRKMIGRQKKQKQQKQIKVQDSQVKKQNKIILNKIHVVKSKRQTNDMTIKIFYQNDDKNRLKSQRKQTKSLLKKKQKLKKKKKQDKQTDSNRIKLKVRFNQPRKQDIEKLENIFLKYP